MTDTARDIIEAAIEVFSGKGRHAAHMEEIASLAGVNKAVLYRHFLSKDDIYRDIIRRIVFEFCEELVCYFETAREKNFSQETAVRSLIDFLFFLLSNNAEYTAILMDAVGNGGGEFDAAVTECLRLKGDRLYKEADALFSAETGSGLRTTDCGNLLLNLIGMVFICFFENRTCLDGAAGRDGCRDLERMKKNTVDLALSGILARSAAMHTGESIEQE